MKNYQGGYTKALILLIVVIILAIFAFYYQMKFASPKASNSAVIDAKIVTPGK